MFALNDMEDNRMSMIFWMLSKGTFSKIALDDLVPHGECGTPQFNLDDDAGSSAQNRHLPKLFLESDCVLCEPCLFSSNALVRPLKHFCVFCF